MGRPTIFRLNRALHQLALGTWFGALAAFVIAAINTFAVTRQYHPVVHLAPFDNPAFAEHTTDILAGGIVIHVLGTLAWLQIACAALLVLTTLLDATAFAGYLRGGRSGAAHVVQMVLAAGIVIILVVNLLWIMPHMETLRGNMYDPGQTLAQRQDARTDFDLLHGISEKMTTAQAGLLLIALFVSPFVSQTPTSRGGQETQTDG